MTIFLFFAAAVLLAPLFLKGNYLLNVFVFVGINTMLAVALNLLLGYAGQISLGHAAFFGVGAYAVAILGRYGIHSAFVVWPLAVAGCMLLALPVGAVSLRTSGTYFIMITLAFGQMLYYLFVSLKGYGGSDGMALASRNTMGGLVNLGRCDREIQAHGPQHLLPARRG